jgi:hypothetical protein
MFVSPEDMPRVRGWFKLGMRPNFACQTSFRWIKLLQVRLESTNRSKDTGRVVPTIITTAYLIPQKGNGCARMPEGASAEWFYGALSGALAQ